MSARKRCIEWLSSIEAGSVPVVADDDSASAQDSVLEQPGSRDRKRKRALLTDMATDENETPRPHRAKRVHTADDDDEDLPSLHSTNSRRSRASDSPTKGSSGSSLARQTNRLKAAGQYNERLITELSNKDALPEPLAQLLSALAKFADGTGTLPQSLRPRLQQEEEINTSRADLFYDDHDHVMSGEWVQIDDLVKQARRCRLRRDYEAGWNSAVHHPMLNLAARLSGHADHVWAVNISDVRPQRRLVPSGQDIRKKMVDFGLVINTQASHQTLASFYRSPQFPLCPWSDGMKTWNHTEGQLIAEQPLAVSVETKRQGDKDDEAHLQLGTWGTAHLNRLIELRKSTCSHDPAEIFLPQIKIQGAHFSFMLLHGAYDGKSPLKVTHYTGKMMGDATEFGGFFRVLACLRAIVAWVHLSYGPWLQDWTGASGEP